jgi:hypothetical protein
LILISEIDIKQAWQARMYSLTIRLLLTTHVYSQLTAQLILLLLRAAAAAYRSNLQGDTSVINLHSLLYSLSSMDGNILISFIP